MRFYVISCIVLLILIPALARGYSPSSEWNSEELQAFGNQWENRNQISQTTITNFPTTGNIRLVSILVEFPEDTDSTTTGTGKMLKYPEVHEDHDRIWFLRNLENLADYYETVSYGQLNLNSYLYSLRSNLFPRTGQPYLMPHQMAYYSYQDEADTNSTRLVELFRDAIAALDNDPDMDFTTIPEKTAFLVIHAGSNSATDVFGDTPNDIPSAFITPTDLKNVLGVDHLMTDDEIPVYGGGIVSETNSQDYIIIDNLGNWAYIFARQLGIPDLFDTETGETRVGMWDLMDFGQWNYKGFRPAFLSAWARVRCGWVEPIIVNETNTYTLRAAERYPDVIKIPITNQEYFLIENREKDANGNGYFDSYEYDYSLPGSGLLIWHIDENIIEEKLSANQVNNDPQRKGIDLEEADGIQDLDDFRGDYFAYGFYQDAFFAENNDRFADETTPNNRSNSGAKTHFTIGDISEYGVEMTLTITKEWQQEIPAPLPISSTDFTTGNIDDDPAEEMIFLTEEVIMVHHDRIDTMQTSSTPQELVLANLDDDNPSEMIILLENSIGVWNGDGSPVFSQPMIYTGAVGDVLFLESASSIVFTENEHLVRVVKVPSLQDETVLTLPDDHVIDEVIAFPEGEIVVLAHEASNYHLIMVNLATFETKWQGDLPTPQPDTETAQMVGISDQDGKQILIGIDRYLYGFDANGIMLPEFPQETQSAIQKMAVGDLNLDGVSELYVNEGGNRLSGWTVTHGSSIENFPVSTGATHSTVETYSTNEIVIGDIDGDQLPDVLSLMDDNSLYAWNHHGILAEGFPIPVVADAQLTLLDFDGDNDLEIAAIGSDSKLIDLPATYDKMLIQWKTDHSTGVYQVVDPPNQNNTEILMEIYNFPNPVINQGFTHIFYKINQISDVNIQIFDLAGDRVAELTKSSRPPSDMIRWKIDDIATGVYICRLEATSPNGSSTKFHKIAIIK